MSLHHEWENYGADFMNERESTEDLNHRKKIRKLLEDKLEKKRLRDEIDELDGEFDWDEIEKM